ALLLAGHVYHCVQGVTGCSCQPHHSSVRAGIPTANAPVGKWVADWFRTNSLLNTHNMSDWATGKRNALFRVIHFDVFRRKFHTHDGGGRNLLVIDWNQAAPHLHAPHQWVFGLRGGLHLLAVFIVAREHDDHGFTRSQIVTP